jgi:hypothetical protein
VRRDYESPFISRFSPAGEVVFPRNSGPRLILKQKKPHPGDAIQARRSIQAMGFSLVAEALLAAHLQHASWTRVWRAKNWSNRFDAVYHSPGSRVCIADSRPELQKRKRGRFQVHENK